MERNFYWIPVSSLPINCCWVQNSLFNRQFLPFWSKGTVASINSSSSFRSRHRSVWFISSVAGVRFNSSTKICSVVTMIDVDERPRNYLTSSSSLVCVRSFETANYPTIGHRHQDCPFDVVSFSNTFSLRELPRHFLSLVRSIESVELQEKIVA